MKFVIFALATILEFTTGTLTTNAQLASPNPKTDKASQTPSESWKAVRNFSDPSGRGVAPAAVLHNREGFQIALVRGSTGEIWITFSLPRGSFEQLPKRGRIGAFRPDDKEATHIDTTGILGTSSGSNGQTARRVVFHGEGPLPKKGTLSDILSSRVVSARLYTDRGSTIDTTFRLEGAAPIITRALNLKR